MILLIDNYDSFTFNLYQLLAQLGAEVKVIRNDQITLEDIAAMPLRGIVLSPGPGRPEDAGICINVIKRFAGVVPILGVCLGHQAMAVAFGGEVIRASSIMHGKPSMVFHKCDGLYRDLTSPFSAGRYHSLVVAREHLPSELIVDAETDDGFIMGMRHREYLIFGLQFHPESIMTPEGGKLLKTFLEHCS